MFILAAGALPDNPLAWFDDPAKYYAAPDDDVALSQGDIVVAPTIVIARSDNAVSDAAAPTDLGQERLVTLWHGKPKSMREAPSLSANVRWSLAMVLPHDCALEKDWNERVVALIDDGRPQEEAEAIANADETLDPHIVLAPILTYDLLPEPRHASTKQGRRLGIFPVCASEHIPESFVDFTRISTVHHRLISINYRVARLSAIAVGFLKHAIATYFALRSKSRANEFAAAIGQRIADIQTSAAGNQLRLSILLDSGQTLIVEADPRLADAGPVRKPR